MIGNTLRHPNVLRSTLAALAASGALATMGACAETAGPSTTSAPGTTAEIPKGTRVYQTAELEEVCGATVTTGVLSLEVIQPVDTTGMGRKGTDGEGSLLKATIRVPGFPTESLADLAPNHECAGGFFWVDPNDITINLPPATSEPAPTQS